MKAKLLLLLFLTLGAYLRLANLPSRVPFDWDQERDMLALEKMVTEKRPTLVGPVVRGEGGFLLGPLYTYLLLPGYLLSHGNPLSAPVTNVILDLVTGIGIFTLSHASGIIWFLSPLIIANSLTAWNVGLIPLWTLFAYYIYKQYRTNHQRFLPYVALLSGLAWHIHASLIPLSLLWLFSYLITNFRKLKLITLVFSFICYLIPLSPLILFDLRHDFVNLKLFYNFLIKENLITYPFSDVISDVMTKYFLFLSSLIYKHLLLGVGLSAILIIKLIKDKEHAIKAFFYVSITTILLLITQFDTTFPEYYFSVILVPAVLSAGYLIKQFKQLSWIMTVVIALLLTSFSLKLTKNAPPYSLANKIALVNELKDHNSSVDLRYELSPGRGSGFPYLLRRAQVNVQENSAIHIVIKDTKGPASKVDNLMPVSVKYLGPFVLETYQTHIVQ